MLDGKAILADVKDAEGRNSKAFVQIDTETNQVMSVPTPVIGRNLEVLKDELKLSLRDTKNTSRLVDLIAFYALFSVY